MAGQRKQLAGAQIFPGPAGRVFFNEGEVRLLLVGCLGVEILAAGRYASVLKATPDQTESVSVHNITQTSVWMGIGKSTRQTHGVLIVSLRPTRNHYRIILRDFFF